MELVNPMSNHFLSWSGVDGQATLTSIDGTQVSCSCGGTAPNTGCNQLRGSWSCSGLSAEIVVASDTEDMTASNPKSNVCLNDKVLVEGELRIVNGDQVTTGRLEIYHNNEWGSICDDYGRTCSNFGDVACSQMGFQNCVTVHSYSGGGGSGTAEQMSYHVPIQPPSRIWLDEVNCNADVHSTLSDCGNIGWGNHNCAHGEDVAIQCANPISRSTSAPTSPTETPSYDPTVSPTMAPTNQPSTSPTVSCPEAGRNVVNWHNLVCSLYIIDLSQIPIIPK